MNGASPPRTEPLSTSPGRRLAALWAIPSPPARAVGIRQRHPILGESLFREAILREQRRADRFDTPFALLLLALANGSGQADSWAPVLRAVSATKRDTDLAGWLHDGRVLGLLLPDASAKSALQTEHRLRREMSRRLDEPQLSALSVHPYSLGDRCGTDPLPPIELVVETFASSRDLSWRDIAKRALDVAGSLAFLVLFSPVFAVVWAAVRWTFDGPAIYRQVRIGRGGEAFTMLKFRTMYVNAEDGIHRDYVSWFIKSSTRQPHAAHEVFKLTDDPRITPLGRFLRRTSLDELPQFWNVLRGEMSLVGPRPPLPFEVEQYKPWHRRRVLEAKPGVTGPWQVRGRSQTTFDEMVRIDLHYARTHSLWTDIKILAATPRAMLSGKGAC